ncbi:GGDEF domain-containing protein [Sphingomonas canadensis]|uniref:GGDEF domain-containing protein n=1 Tax=Sphingomonas canadensis TaxID=1219257 RepID=A0ABW3HC74_9SPHN|nr:sensor domain-containing diguanylate cyclase [Sphingomonas canadensis]MCW3838054.1 diguanylate cyclase [Sphingomonas canadensis]
MYEPAVAREGVRGTHHQARNVRRLIALGATAPLEIAGALAQDALQLVPDTVCAMVELSGKDAGRITAGELPDQPGTPALEAAIPAAQGSVGTIMLWTTPGTMPSPEAPFALDAITWLAAAAFSGAALRRAEEHWHKDRRRLDATFSAAPVGIAHVAPDGSFLAVNERFAAITGHSREDLLGSGFQRITHPDDLANDVAHVRRLLSGQTDRYIMEKRYLRPDGSVVWVNLTVALVRDATGEPDFFVSVIEDLSEIRAAREDAKRDPLTGLLNRRGLLDFLEPLLRRYQPVTLVYADLDAFKTVNDRFGHAHGDACVTAAAQALSAIAGSGARVARVGGDEFVIAAPGVTAMGASAMVSRLRLAIAAIEVAPGWPMSASFGRATAEPGSRADPSALIAEADAAMYRDKQRPGRLARATRRP